MQAQSLTNEDWLVLQDAVVARGGLHGGLMHVAPDRMTAQLEAVLPRLLDSFAYVFPGHAVLYEQAPYGGHAPGSAWDGAGYLDLKLEHGFVNALAVHVRICPPEGWTADHWLIRTLHRVLTESVGRLARVLEITATGEGGDIGRVLDFMARATPVAARQIDIRASRADCGPLWKMAPYLERLSLDTSPGLGVVKHECLRSLELSGRLDEAALAALVTADVPALESLTLVASRDEDDADGLRSLLIRPFGNLRALGLRSLVVTPSLARTMVSAPWWMNLQRLDLTASVLEDEAGRTLSTGLAHLPHLQKVTVDPLDASGEWVRRLHTVLGDRLDVDGLWPDDFEETDSSLA